MTIDGTDANVPAIVAFMRGFFLKTQYMFL